MLIDLAEILANIAIVIGIFGIGICIGLTAGLTYHWWWKMGCYRKVKRRAINSLYKALRR